MKSQPELTLHIKNDMTQIGKVEWVYRFCFREAVQGKKKAMQQHRLPQISYSAWGAPQRCPILRMSKAIIISKIHCFYS